MTQIPEHIQAWLDRDHQLFIGGEWVAPEKGVKLDVFNPATTEKISSVSLGDSKDIDRAVKAARSTFATWRNSRPAIREKLLLDLADAIEAKADDFAMLETLDNGKPFTVARDVDVAAVVTFIRYTAGWAT